MVSDDDVRYVARLARLKLKSAELDRYSRQLSGIIDHINKIAELDLKDVEPTSHVTRLENVFRADTPWSSVSQEKALLNAPEAEAGAFKVPQILEAGEQ